MIPSILHQTWKNTEIPDQWKASYDSCQRVMASYTRRLWTDEEMEAFVKQNYPDMYNTYMSYPYHIQRCDSFRYMLLYKIGGVYLDMDIACKLSIDKLLSYDIVLAKSPNVERYITNSILMTVPGHPFFRYVIDKLKVYKDKYRHLGKHLHVMNSTGPVFFTDVYNQYVKENSLIPNIYLMSKEEFSGDCSVCSDVCAGGKYFTHVTGKSWNSWDTTLYNAIMCHWQKMLLLLIIISIIVYYIKTKKTGSRRIRR
jgi:mannosyltransferase OCH1-like enzyme